MSRKAFIAAIGLIAAALAATGAISASAANDDSSANQLAGSWQLTVDRGPALPPVKGLTTYTTGHSLIGTANNVIRGPAHGTWVHVSGRTYADTHIFFRSIRPGRSSGPRRSERRWNSRRTATPTRRWRSRICSIQVEISLSADSERPSPRRGSKSNQSHRRPSAEEARDASRAFSAVRQLTTLEARHVEPAERDVASTTKVQHGGPDHGTRLGKVDDPGAAPGGHRGWRQGWSGARWSHTRTGRRHPRSFTASTAPAAPPGCARRSRR